MPRLSRQTIREQEQLQDRLEREIAALKGELAQRDDTLRAIVGELHHLSAVRLPESVMSTAHPRVHVPGLLDNRLAGGDVDRLLTQLMQQAAQFVVDERRRGDEAAKAVMRGVMGKLQAQHYRQQTFVQSMQERYDHPDVAQDLVRLDELNERNLRLVQGLAVVCGRWPGLAREDSPVQDIVKSATGRVVGYQRVARSSYQVRGRLAVTARAVEPLAMILAELLDNALSHSPSNVDVEVAVKHGASGCTFFVTDWGLGMSAEELRRANGLASGELGQLLTDLEGEPPGIGLPVVGAIARQYGFHTVLEPSPYSHGLRAAVLVPEPLLVTIEDRYVEDPYEEPAVLPAQRETYEPGPGAVPSTAPSAVPSTVSSAGLDGLGGFGVLESPAAEPGHDEHTRSALPQRRALRRRAAEGQAPPDQGSWAQPPGGWEQGDPAIHTHADDHPPLPPLQLAEQAGFPEPDGPSPAQSRNRWAALQLGTAAGRAADDEHAVEERGTHS